MMFTPWYFLYNLALFMKSWEIAGVVAITMYFWCHYGIKCTHKTNDQIHTGVEPWEATAVINGICGLSYTIFIF